MYGGKLQTVRFRYIEPSIEAVLDRLPTATVKENPDGGWDVEAEMFRKGVDMWLNNQGENVHMQGKSIYYPVSPICAYLTFLMHKHVASIQYKGTIATAISKITVNFGKKLHLECTQSTKKVRFRWIGNIRRVNAFALVHML